MTTYSASNIDEIAITATKAGEVVANQGDATISITSATITVGTLVPLCVLPADHIPVDFIGDITDSDSGTSLVFKLGFIDCDTATDDDDAVFGTGYTTGQAGGIFRPTATGFTRIASVPRDRKVGLTVTTLGVAGATAPVVSGTLLCRRKDTNRDR